MTHQHEPTLNLLGIAGSLRENSFNRWLLQAAAQQTPRGAQLTVYPGLAAVPPFNEDLEAVVPVGVAQLRQALRRADGLLIATPEYNQSVPGVLKNAIDWLSRSDPSEGIAGKPVAVIGATTGPWGTRLAQTQLRQMLVSCEALLLPSPALYVKDARGLFDQSGSLVDRETRRRLNDVTAALVDWTRLVTRQADIKAFERAG